MAHEPSGSPQGPVRSRLTPEREAELYGAVLDLLVETGYESLTMDAVAHRAKTSKATIYRQWLGKPGLVAAALRSIKEPHDDYDTGSLRGDLQAVARAIGEVAEANAHLFSAVGHAIQSDPALAETVRQSMFKPNNDMLQALLERAIARGEIAPDNPALSHVPGLFLQAVVSRPVVEGQPVDADSLADLVDHVILPALGAASPTSEQ